MSNNQYGYQNQFGNQGYNYQPNFQQNFRPQYPVITNIEYVSGIESVKAMPLPPNCTKFVLDSEQKVFYIKKTDAEGRPYIKAYPYIDEEEKPKIEFATLQQFTDLKNELEELKKVIEGKNG